MLRSSTVAPSVSSVSSRELTGRTAWEGEAAVVEERLVGGQIIARTLVDFPCSTRD